MAAASGSGRAREEGEARARPEPAAALRTSVEFDEAEKLIKVRSCNGLVPRATGAFGSSTLYEFAGYNFHPRAYHVLANVARLEFRPSDVLLTMFPKSGSTWLSECVYLVVTGYDYARAAAESIELRFPQVDSPSHDVLERVVRADARAERMIKASIPPHLLVEREPAAAAAAAASAPRVISVFRNPRDVLVSFFHHCKTVKHYDLQQHSFDAFFDTFAAGRVPCGPIWRMFNDAHAYHARNPATSLLVFYEDMKADLRGQVERICRFLGKPPPADERAWHALLEHLSVDKMRANKTINRSDWHELGLANAHGSQFVRKGQANDWRNYFDETHVARFERLIANLTPELARRYSLSAC